MASYFLAFAWGFCIILSLIGWGGVVNRILFPNSRVDWGQRAAWGIAFSVFVGGVLNTTWTISRITILIYLGLGFISCLLDFYKNRRLLINSLHRHVVDCRKDKVLFTGTLIACFLILAQYASWVSTPHEFNGHDDYHAYLVFPKKMIEMGSMGPDPFSERRIEASLGGGTFLDTFILCAVGEKNLNIIDIGCGLIIAGGLILGLFKNKNISKTNVVFIFTIIFLLLTTVTMNMKVNISSLVIPLALLLSLYRTLAWKQLKLNNLVANACIIALLTAATCALKSNLIPPCIILFTFSYFFHIIDSKMQRKAVYEFLAATSLIGVFLLPWMISMYQSSGTLLYPILGRGYHGSVYGNYLLPSSGLTISKVPNMLISILFSVDFLAVLLLGFIIIVQQRQKLICRESPISFVISAGLGTVSLALVTGGFEVPYKSFSSRYSFSFVAPTVIILLTMVLNDLLGENRFKLKRFNSAIAALFFTSILLISFNAKDSYTAGLHNIKLGLKNVPIVSNHEVEQYTKMLQAIPKGETILTRMQKPFLLDFSRNRVFIVDLPGGASLPPGMPAFKGSEALANYLTSKSIRYVGYSYASEAGFSKKEFGGRLRSIAPVWLRTVARHSFDFQENLKALGKTRKRIYDDGNKFVLDLLSLNRHQ